ncbi:MAG: HEAT repeat domain-containing protein, partial [Dongiaceae bacterium]
MTGMVRRARVLAAAALVVGVAASSALGNGWEHHAIPLPALLAALDGADDELRAQAALSLGVRQEPAAVEPLLRLLDRPEDSPGVRGPVYQALGRIGDARAVPALLGALDAEDREELRAEAVQALGAIGDAAVLPRLLAALDGDPSLIVRTRAIDALGNFAAPAAVEALAALALDGKSQSVRLRAVRALG